MSWIEMRDEDEVLAAGDRLSRLYRACLDPEHGVVDNILKVHSLAPETLDGHLRLYRSVMHTAGELSRREREVIAVAVSACNECHY